jgi:hypothetical protein
MEQSQRSVSADKAAVFVAVFAGVVILGFGLWAFIDPESFYDEIALFPPYNEHFVHDIGAFQIGIGAALLLAVVWRSDALLVVLAGAGIGAALHWVAHVIDSDQGGEDSDYVILGILAIILLATAGWRWANTRGRVEGG